MKILITGGFGYLGGRLGQYLAAHGGHEIVLASRSHEKAPAWLPQAGAVRVDWDASDCLQSICAGVDAVVHVARMNAADCAADPEGAMQFNGLGTQRLVRAAVRRGVRKFVFVSTAHVYCNPLVGVIDEDTPPMSVHSYGLSHLAGEDAVRQARDRGEIAGTVLRLSNSFGAPAHARADCWMLLFNDLCRRAVTERRLVLLTAGLQRRNFLPMQDACGAIAHVLGLPDGRAGRGLFNVGGDWSPTVWDAACLVQERCAHVLGFQPDLVRAEPGANEVPAELDYRHDALRRSGFEPVADRVAELDGLLRFCADSFA